MFKSPGEIFFSVGNISVHYYGLCISLGIVIGLLFSYFICKKYYKDIDPDIIFDVAIPVIIFGIIGARLYYCLLSMDYYSRHLLEIIQIYKGGLSIHGAIIGGLIGGVSYAKVKKLPVLKLCDIFAFAVIIGQIIGRWGNFFNSEAFGLPTSSFLKMYIPKSSRPIEFIQYEYFHPTFLYESLLNVFVLIILFLLLRNKEKPGTVFFVYLILYSAVRIFVEFIRVDSIQYIGAYPIAVVVSILIIILSILALRKI